MASHRQQIDEDIDFRLNPPRKITFAPPAAGPHSSFTLYMASSLMCLVSLSSFFLGVSYVYCPSDMIPLIEPIRQDDHYKYLLPLLVPVTAWFGIANWVGWEYFRYS
ncbi:uncharacterized protein I303_103832 [Kwoniella dejecticola CBS 10117]|uniref:Uncharacterized protein n=1 Tax=Kwoniella dejecticola CBS 10117 TaxID=1296121 RepID=A0A1A6A7V1_9TREE|nr:uncharacterized protein I303_03851 [Kwoniella dejecticola CBS 10117]OBR86131.1 hypothetical protein I303_03851 [Kwoniella dejecticola CBS 10117]